MIILVVGHLWVLCLTVVGERYLEEVIEYKRTVFIASLTIKIFY